MNKEQLVKIKNSIIRTVEVVYEESLPDDTEFLMEKLNIIRDKVMKLCNDNKIIANGVMVTALEEYIRNKFGDTAYEQGMLEALKKHYS